MHIPRHTAHTHAHMLTCMHTSRTHCAHTHPHRSSHTHMPTHMHTPRHTAHTHAHRCSHSCFQRLCVKDGAAGRALAPSRGAATLQVMLPGSSSGCPSTSRVSQRARQLREAQCERTTDSLLPTLARESAAVLLVKQHSILGQIQCFLGGEASPCPTSQRQHLHTHVNRKGQDGFFSGDMCLV